MTCSAWKRCWLAAFLTPLLGLEWSSMPPDGQIAATPRHGAVGKAADPDDEASDDVDIFLPLDYSRQSKLDRAERMVREEKYDDAVRLLGELISESADAKPDGGEPEDYFLRSAGGSTL